MRRDASVCPHCRHESPAWEFRHGRWWTSDAAGREVWYDEREARWRQRDDVPPPPAATYSVVVVSMGDPSRTAQAIWRHGNHDYTTGALRRMPPGTAISDGLPADRATALKDELAQAGTVVNLVEV